MAITFNEIPANLREPGVFAEVDPSGAIRGLVGIPARLVVIGAKLSGGTATANTPVQVLDAAQARGLFGQHSQLARMFAAIKAQDPWTETWAVPMADAVAGVAATGTLTFSGTVTQAGTLNLYIGGRRVRVAVAAAEANATTATNVAAAITAAEDMPVTASANAAVVTLTSRHKGTIGNAIDVRANYWPGDALPSGLAVAIVAMASGATNPDIATALAALADEWFTDICSAWTDSSNMTALETELSSRFSAMVGLDAHAYVGLSDTHANLITWAGSRNSPHVTALGAYKSPTPPDEWAAALAVRATKESQADPARPLETVALTGLLPPAIADRFDATERNLLLFDGISTWRAGPDGVVRLSRVITSYQLNSLGAADAAWLDITTPKTATRVRYEVKAAVQRDHARHKIANDGTRFGAGQAVSTPSSIKGTIAAALMLMEQAGLVEAVQETLASTIVERNATDPTRVDVLLPPDFINPLYVIAIKLQFRL